MTQLKSILMAYAMLTVGISLSIADELLVQTGKSTTCKYSANQTGNCRRRMKLERETQVSLDDVNTMTAEAARHQFRQSSLFGMPRAHEIARLRRVVCKIVEFALRGQHDAQSRSWTSSRGNRCPQSSGNPPPRPRFSRGCLPPGPLTVRMLQIVS